MRTQFFLPLRLSIFLLVLQGCAYIGPPPEPALTKADQVDALSYLRALPPSSKRDQPVCKYLESGLKNITGEIIPYDQFLMTTKIVGKETFISLLLPARRQYLSIPTTSDFNNECVAYRYEKQQEYAFYWGKDRKQEEADKIRDALQKLGIKAL